MSTRIDPTDQSMIGKIGNKSGDTSAAGKVRTETSSHKEVATPNASGEDTVELTSNAKLLERLERSLESVPDIDRARIEAVKSQIENGEYQIDADNIAESLLRIESELDRRS